MREIVVLSGKGGTGKTTLAGVFATLGQEAVMADADVDAANLHLILRPRVLDEEPFSGSRQPVVDQEVCIQCGLCTELCRFDAIEDGLVDEIACEGCEVCFHACPVEAVRLEDTRSGNIYTCSTDYGPFVYAKLGVAQENSGKLVVRVKERAREVAERENKHTVVVDGAPGIGCPVIASLGGVDLTLIVTEPTAAGFHDLDRVLGLARHFGVPAAVCVNKADLDEGVTTAIEDHCRLENVAFVGRIPFARGVVQSLVARSPVTEDRAGEAASAMHDVWRRTLDLLPN
ncbi:MAG: ATP-binding protein [Candidatus Desulforudis sp.]|nr:ATP-binding protein [Desulforudis sp.]